MIHPTTVTTIATATASDPETEARNARLHEATQQLEGVFMQHLMKSMRATVPNGGNPDAPGADLYGSLLDEHLAQTVANKSSTGIAEALYRQLTATPLPAAGEGDRS